MENKTFFSGMSIKNKIIMLTVLVASLIVMSSLFFTLNTIREQLLSAGEKEITELVEVTYNVLDMYNKKAKKGEITLDQAKQMAMYQVSQMKYQGKNYIWLTDYNDNMLTHPTLTGKSITSVADKNGITFFHDGVVLAKKDGEGFVNYHWTKQGVDSSKVFPKVSYFKSFPEWEWVIATGIYVDEVNDIVKATFVKTLLFNIVILVLIVVAVILTLVKDIVKSMEQITNDLDDTSRMVESASLELDANSQELSSGSTEQAASVQETSSTLEETSSMIQQNNENTKQAAFLAKQSKEFATKSNEEMGKMILSIDELKKSSDEISKIIKVIDEIAFQTNILSLNAAVEAARAGDAGKGFAVVAEEVRTLAQKSAQAAKETAKIIERNIQISQTSSEITKEVQKSIKGIDEQDKKVSDLLDEIAVATNEQAQGVDQINKAVSQMEIVISSNAQMAEKSAVASKDLYNQTSNMNEIIGRLRAFVNGSV
jgi:methyl-accepting chemotaxis protein